MPAYHLYHHPV
ncbi:hypothetical protein VULLAG_LOCUS11969 [Vulpes lagopus]